MKKALSYLIPVALALLLSGCAMQIPADPDGTLDRVSGATIRVGISANPPWTQISENGTPTGSEVELVRRFARSIDADVEWVQGGEEALMEKIDRGELDVVIGGLTGKSPWTDKAALTRPYTTARSETTGEDQEHVMAVRMGENAFLLRLETFLLEQGAHP